MTTAITTVTSFLVGGPFGTTGFVGNSLNGFEIGPYITSGGSLTSGTAFGQQIFAIGAVQSGSTHLTAIQIAGLTTGLFTTATIIQGATVATFSAASFNYYPAGSTAIEGQTCPPLVAPIMFVGNGAFSSSTPTTVILTNPVPNPPAGKGDITDPEAWQDALGTIPPIEFNQVPENTNYPQNGDGRYWFNVNMNTVDSGSPISFIGDPRFYVDTASLQWSVTSTANDGSGALLAYSTDGATWTTTTLLPQTQLSGLQSGEVLVNLNSATAFLIQVYTLGGTTSTAGLTQVALAITRNQNEGLQWDSPNPFNPMSYNAQCMDQSVYTDTLSSLRQRVLTRLGFANSAANPPPGMTALVNDFLASGQRYLYRRYKQLHTTRLFRWKINPGQRFYSLLDNDEDVLCDFTMDPNKRIEWSGIQDSRNVWYPLVQGIPPQLYTMINKPWRPARYEIRQAIEVYPTPDQTYWMWFKGHFGLQSFTLDTQSTTLDAELVFLWALANAKNHYGQPDANAIAAQANDYRKELIAGTHQTASYIPGTIAVPPAVRPTLIQYQDNQGG